MPDLLKNPFLQLGVSADASASDIKKVADRALMELRLHGDSDSPKALSIERAMEELRDPLKRFQWGLFWPEFSPGEADAYQQHPILSTLGERPRQNAVHAYKEICTTESMVVKNHNFGVLALVVAVAATEHAQKGTPDDISDDLACVKLWDKAFEYLTPIFDSDEFWMRQKMRAKSIDDPRLDKAYLDRCRNDFLSDVIAPVGHVIKTALLDGHSEVASTYVDFLSRTVFDDAFIDKTLSEVYKPLADRVEHNVTSLNDRMRKLDEASDDIGNYERLIAEFESEVMHDLDVMLDVGDLPGYAEEHARDTSAEFLREFAIDSWNSTHNAAVSEKALKYALKYADASSLKAKFKKDLSQITSIAKSNSAMKKVEPLIEQMQELYEREDYVGVLPVIDQIIALVPSEQKEEFRRIRLTAQGNAAVDYANRGISYANSGKTALALKLLKQSLEYEHRPDHIAMIKRAIRQLGIPGTGLSTGTRQADGCLTEIGMRILVVAIICIIIAVCAGIMGD